MRLARWLGGWPASTWRWLRRGRGGGPQGAAARGFLGPGPEPAAAIEAVPTLKIWLFGGLAQLAHCRSYTVPLDRPTTLGEVLDALVEHFGTAFGQAIRQDDGRLIGCCRIFLDGFPLTGLEEPIAPKPGVANLELIVLPASEGG